MLSHDSLAVNEAIEGYIKAFQPEFLLCIVGKSLASAITDYLELIEHEKEESTEKKEDPESVYALLCDKLREPFADYVFFHILRDMNTQATITGLVRLKCANEYISPIRKQVSIWNSMVCKNRQFVEWVSDNDYSFNVKIDKNLLTPINTFNL